jgi:aquaglyceroporin related protein
MADKRHSQIYILFQILGGILGAAVTYANYYHAIDVLEGPGNRTLKTAGLFSTYAVSILPYLIACILDESS